MGYAQLIELALNLIAVGIERAPIIAKVQEMETAGATADQISDALRAMRQQSETDAQAAIDKL